MGVELGKKKKHGLALLAFCLCVCACILPSHLYVQALNKRPATCCVAPVRLTCSPFPCPPPPLLLSTAIMAPQEASSPITALEQQQQRRRRLSPNKVRSPRFSGCLEGRNAHHNHHAAQP
jgi:hypothetical protein